MVVGNRNHRIQFVQRTENGPSPSLWQEGRSTCVCDNVVFMPHHPAQIAIWISTWLLCGLVFFLILWRPRRIPEYVWAVAGAVLLVLFRLLPLRAAWMAIRSGTDVYLFLAGMMILAELARNHGVFDWLAAEAMGQAKGSQTRLFMLVYSDRHRGHGTAVQ